MNTLLAREIHDKALACGYDSCGIVPLDALDFYKDRLTKRLEDVPESEEVYAHSKAFLALKDNYLLMLEKLYYEHIPLHFQVHLLNASSTDLYKNQVHQEALYHNYHSHMLALYHESLVPIKYSYHRLLNID